VTRITSPRFGISYADPSPKDERPDVTSDVQRVVAQLEALGALYVYNTIAARPAAGVVGRFFISSDENPKQLYFDFGTGWAPIGAIADGAITTAKLVDGAVTTLKIADGAVTAIKLAADSVTQTALADNSVGTNEIQGSAVVTAKIADAAITTIKILDGSVTNAKLAGAIDPTKVSGTAAVIGDPRFTDTRTPTDNSVSTVKIQAGAVNFSKIASDVPVVPIGAMMDWPWASGSLPSWAALPYGQAISRAGFTALAALAAAAGYPFGAGDGSTTFNLPDLRGRTTAGKDDMGGTLASRITAAISGVSGATLGAVVGSEGVVLATGQIPAHNHTQSAHSHTVNSHGHTISGTPNINNGSLAVAGGGSHNHFSPYAENFLGIAGNGSGTGNALYAGAIDRGYEVYGTSNVVQGGGSAPVLTGAVTGDKGTLVADAASPGTDAQTPAIQNTGGGGTHLNVQPTIVVNKMMRVS
jgi:microcystin-dependent protein